MGWQRNQAAKILVVAILTLIKYSLLAVARSAPGVRIKGELLCYDALMIISGIDFSNYAGRWPIYYSFFLTALFGIDMRKPVMCYAQSIGPIDDHAIRRLARFFLNRMRTINVREENSWVFLRERNVNRPTIHLTADLAFFLPPIYRQSGNIIGNHRIPNTHRPLTGLSLSLKPFTGPGTGCCSMGLWYVVGETYLYRAGE